MDIQISWDLYSDPCAKFQEVLIFARQSVAVPFTQIATITNVSQLSYTHTGAAALGSSWQYYIVYRYLCDDSEFQSDTLVLDISQPNISDFDSVSYDPVSGGIIMGWRANPAVDLMGYIIYRDPVGEIDRTYGTLTYTDMNGSPLTNPSVYKLTAFDSCINQSVISPEHRIPFLQHTANSCGTEVTLTWDHYQGAPVSRYDIYTKTNTNDFVIDTTLSASQNSLVIEVTSGDAMEVFVRAILSTGYTSRSNPVTFQALDSFSLTDNYLSSLTWSNKNTFILDGLADASFDFDSIYLYQYTSPNALGELIVEVENTTAVYPLTLSLEETLPYSFQQIMVDRCQRRYLSNVAENVLLTGSTPETDSYSLNWNAPEYWQAPIASQEVNLGDNLATYSTWNTLDEVNPDTFYTTSITTTELNLRCFQVRVNEAGPNIHGLSATVYSNPVCFIQEPSIHFPSAIIVKGINNEFRPVGLSVDREKSHIKIYSRSGQLVFSSNLLTYFDGRNGLEPYYQSGVYLWMADIHYLDGTREHHAGNLTVLY